MDQNAKRGAGLIARWGGALKTCFSHPARLGILATLLTLCLIWSNALQLSHQGRNLTLDVLTRYFPYETLYPHNAQRLVFVDIDDRSLAQVGQWPWPRQTMAQLIHKITATGATAVGVDVLFTEKDRFSPDSLSQILAIPKPLIVSAGGVDGDAQLAEALATGPVALAMALSTTADTASKATPVGRFISTGTAGHEILPSASLLLPIPALSAAQAQGFVNTYKSEGLVRETPLLAQVGASIVPSLNLEMLRLAEQAENYFMTDSGVGHDLQLQLGGLAFTVSQQGTLIFHHGHSGRFQRISASTVLHDASVDLKGKLVIVGSGATGLGDRHSTSLEDDIAGPLFHLQAIDQILSGRFITHHAVFDVMVLLLCALLAAFFCVLIARAPLGYTLLALPLIALGLIAGAGYGFIQGGFLFNVPMAMLVLLSGPLTTYVKKSLVEAQLRKKMQSSFAQYVPADIVKRISQVGQQPSLGGEEIEASVLFLDIRGYTTLTETLNSDPKLLVQAIGLIMNAVTERLIAEGATIDKYIGDAVMAFWNAPEAQADHQLRALRAALAIDQSKGDIQQAVRALSPALQHLHIDFGIGVATGAVIVGNMGSDFRFNYTVMGDTVNVASRLESLTKDQGHSILAMGGELGQVHFLQGQAMQASPLGPIAVKGKQQATEVFAIRGANA